MQFPVSARRVMGRVASDRVDKVVKEMPLSRHGEESYKGCQEGEFSVPLQARRAVERRRWTSR